ncbi:DinB family protein [Alkalihalobacillus oceani]|uniref:DinB family protein n=1 Tax=Halalkalibacter oceani TaxID=1653776 RepID=A0A9X2DKR9_9BACI|nr:DinB family protein [Halalkalibacter oceani]MCM3712494.1 DinB family protein [Halalkalibacter oceani]
MKTLEQMFLHLDWANQRIIEALQTNKTEDEEALRLFSHILLAERIWLTRLEGKDSTKLPIWTVESLSRCQEMARENKEKYDAYLSNLTEDILDEPVIYKNSRQTEFHSSIRAILTHVALHGQYHRGQINKLLRLAGAEPVNVDFITFIRS